MKIKDIRLIPLVGATPDGGWPEGDGEDDNLHTLVEVISDEGVVGLGSIFTSAKLSEGALGVLRPMLIGESAIEPVRVCEKLHQTTFWQGRGGSITHFISGSFTIVTIIFIDMYWICIKRYISISKIPFPKNDFISIYHLG